MHKNSISPILRYIEGNYRTCSLESTAKFFNMNPNYMTTLLKNRTGHSYKDLIQKQALFISQYDQTYIYSLLVFALQTN